MTAIRVALAIPLLIAEAVVDSGLSMLLGRADRTRYTPTPR